MRPRASLLGLAVTALCLGASARASGPDRPPPEIPKLGRVSLVRIDGEVDHGLAAFLKRVLSDHREGELVLLELNTLGGRLDSAIAIRDAMLESKATTLCWVRPRAISAGALITLACDAVAVSSGAMVGAATPVQLGAGDPKVDEKIASYMRQEMATTASHTGRPEDVARAMVDADVVVPGLNEKGKLLTLDAAQALQWRVADVQAETEAELWQKLERDPPRVERPHRSAAESLASVLAHPTVALVLMVLGLLGIVIELLHPQGGAALLIGLTCLALFFLGHHVVDLAGWEELVLLGVGLALIGGELLFPGHGVFGIVGVHLVLASLFLALVNLEHLPLGVAWHSGMLSSAMALVFGAALATVGLSVAALRFLPSSRLGKKLILEEVVETPKSGGGGIGLEALVGQVGVALTPLRPMGRVEVINRRAEARLEVGFAPVGAKVKVLRVEGSRVVVQEESQEGGTQ